MSDRERGELFFIIKEGTVAAKPPTPGSPAPAAATRLSPGEFFGECALLAQGSAFAAAVAGAGKGCEGAGGGRVEYVAEPHKVVCLVMRKAEFERLLGPYEELWR